MPDKYLYLLVDLCCISVPFLFSFHARINFHKQWKYLLAPLFITAAVFCFWDVLFTRWGIWSFNPRYLCGIYWLGLPLEEYLFFLCIPYAAIFTYHCISSFFAWGRLTKAGTAISVLLILFLAPLGLLYLPRLYTSVTFLSTAFALLLLLIRKVKFLPAFYASFILILIPFFISNGILTGSFTPEPVVSYNSAYNLGIRMFTIPFEDTFYGMLLLLLNVSGYEYLKNRSSGNQPVTVIK